MEVFKRQMNDYVDALQRQNQTYTATVFDLEDSLASKEKELHEIYNL
jgi:hypothetical protein